MIRAAIDALIRRFRPASEPVDDASESLRRAARRGNHERWHARRGVTQEGCEHCPAIAPNRPESPGDALAIEGDPMAMIRAQTGRWRRSPLSIDLGSKNQIQIYPDLPATERPHLAALRRRGEQPSLRQLATYDALVEGQGGDEAASRWMAALIRDAPARLGGGRLHGHVWSAANALRRRPHVGPAANIRRRVPITVLADDELALTPEELAEVDRELEVPG